MNAPSAPLALLALGLLTARPELRVDRALRGDTRPFIGSTRHTQFTAAMDLLLAF